MRVSCTTLESFRRWSDPEQTWMPEAELLATIRGVFGPTYEVMVGQAFGRVLERPDRYRTDTGDFTVPVYDGSQWREFFFAAGMMAPALDLMDRRAVYEVKGTKDYGAITVVQKADQILGSTVGEHKTTFGTFDFDKYAASYQWRFMADCFEPAWVTYHVFLLKHETDGAVSLRGIESFNLFPYATLHEDCCDLVRRFADYVTLRGLEPVLQARAQYATLV